MDAVIDLGSNSVRLMLTDKKFDKLTQVTQLSQGLSTYGVLCDAAMERTLSVIISFIEYARSKNADNIFIFGTEAMRAAKNSQYFKNLVFDKTGIEIDVISGNDEALCGFLGAVSGKSISKTAGVVDIGGASTEISTGDKDGLKFSQSLPIGTVRLREMFGQDYEHLSEYIKRIIKEYADIKADSFTGIGGTFTSISAMLLKLQRYSSQLVDNSTIKLESLTKLNKELWLKDDNEIYTSYPVLGAERAKVIRYGAFLAQNIMEMLNVSSIAVSEKDNLEGYCILKKIPIYDII